MMYRSACVFLLFLGVACGQAPRNAPVEPKKAPGFGEQVTASAEPVASALPDKDNTPEDIEARFQGCWDEMRSDGFPILRMRFRGKGVKQTSLMRGPELTRPRMENHGVPSPDNTLIQLDAQNMWFQEDLEFKPNPVPYTLSGETLTLADKKFQKIPDNDCLFLSTGPHTIE